MDRGDEFFHGERKEARVDINGVPHSFVGQVKIYHKGQADSGIIIFVPFAFPDITQDVYDRTKGHSI